MHTHTLPDLHHGPAYYFSTVLRKANGKGTDSIPHVLLEEEVFMAVKLEGDEVYGG